MSATQAKACTDLHIWERIEIIFIHTSDATTRKAEKKIQINFDKIQRRRNKSLNEKLFIIVASLVHMQNNNYGEASREINANHQFCNLLA